jgi:competence protein ComEC
VRSPQGKVALFDGGKPTRGFDRYSPPVSYLRHLGIRKVEFILNTHPDADHLGGLKNMVSALPAGSIARAYEGWDAQSTSELFRIYLGQIQTKGISLVAVKEGDSLDDLPPVNLSVIHPPVSFRPRHNRENNRSLAVRLCFSTSSGVFSLILPGDLEEEGIRELLANHRPFPKVDWLLAPHHGRLSGEQALCAGGIKPRFVVLSDWRDYADDHDLYRQGDPEAIVLSTAREGAVEVEVTRDGEGRYRTFLQNQWKPFVIR